MSHQLMTPHAKDAKPPPIFHKQKSTTTTTKTATNHQSSTSRSCSFRLFPVTTKKGSLTTTPIKHLKYVGSKAVGMLKMMSISTPRRSSTKVTSSSSERRANVNVPSFLDTQRDQAINDCIEFINSSSSSTTTTTTNTLSRSKSLSH